MLKLIWLYNDFVDDISPNCFYHDTTLDADYCCMTVISSQVTHASDSMWECFIFTASIKLDENKNLIIASSCHCNETILGYMAIANAAFHCFVSLNQ